MNRAVGRLAVARKIRFDEAKARKIAQEIREMVAAELGIPNIGNLKKSGAGSKERGELFGLG